MTRIFVDVGHGGNDLGAVAGGVREKDVNLAVALELQKIVNDWPTTKKIITYFGRRSDFAQTHEQRVNLAVNFKADYLISIHHNAAVDPAARGIEVFYGKGQADGKLFAENIYYRLNKAFPTMGQRGIKTKERRDGTPWYYMIKYPEEYRIISLITETGFLTNPGNLDVIKGVTFPAKQAHAIALGVLDALGDDFIFKPVPEQVLPIVNNRVEELEKAMQDIRSIIDRFI